MKALFYNIQALNDVRSWTGILSYNWSFIAKSTIIPLFIIILKNFQNFPSPSIPASIPSSVTSFGGSIDLPGDNLPTPDEKFFGVFGGNNKRPTTEGSFRNFEKTDKNDGRNEQGPSCGCSKLVLFGDYLEINFPRTKNIIHIYSCNLQPGLYATIAFT